MGKHKIGLSGKALEDFEKWLCDNHTPLWREWLKEINMNHKWIPDSCWFSLMVDFFDSVGLFINISSESVTVEPFWSFTIDENGIGHEGEDIEYKTRQEARQSSIEKANIIYNDRI